VSTESTDLDGARLSRHQIAAMVARDIPDGAHVNLGIGMPTDVARYTDPGKDVVLHSENGILGMGAPPPEGQEDWDLIDAGKQPVTLLPGGSYTSHADSFAIVRGGHLDVAVLGAFQVSAAGDIANWSVPGATIPAVGGAMDLAVGAKQVWVMLTLAGSQNRKKLVRACTYPLTAWGAVDRIYTDLGVLRPGGDGVGFVVTELAKGATVADIQQFSDAPVVLDEGVTDV
jgi:3-oxoadipate CoA-transferase, beta subunit